MAQSKITLIGFNNYMLESGDNLWANLKMPPEIDKDTLIDVIMLRGGEFEILYSNPFFFKSMIGVWSDQWQSTFEKWVKALNIEYDPLYNYDRHEEYEDIRTEKEDINKKENVKANDSSVSSGSGNTTNTKSAYNSPDYTPHDKSDSSSTGRNTSNSATDVNGTQGRNLSGNIKHNAHLYGNIGVTTSQQMLRDELDINAWNLYEHIAEMFCSEFCIYVY